VNPAVADRLRRARPAGPCRAFPGTDTWTEHPYVDGVVLIGDAAGHNDPTAGCGLSIALRDARVVRDLVLAGARRFDEFAPYAEERSERMRRLRLIADLLNVASVEAGTNRAARRRAFAAAMETMDPLLFPLVLGMFAGPETVPESAVDDRVLSRLRAA
jgi:2-polyprenyl-6-methoxyphenol hydroxylase-like FAD-dependent oxidoreductase